MHSLLTQYSISRWLQRTWFLYKFTVLQNISRKNEIRWHCFVPRAFCRKVISSLWANRVPDRTDLSTELSSFSREISYCNGPSLESMIKTARKPSCHGTRRQSQLGSCCSDVVRYPAISGNLIKIVLNWAPLSFLNLLAIMFVLRNRLYTHIISGLWWRNGKHPCREK